jgi:Fe-S-cluster containining protein
MSDIKKKLGTMVKQHPWMTPAALERELGKIVSENASLPNRRAHVIRFADKVRDALAPHAACRAGCNHCCHMNTMIYEHEAERLAKVTGRKMTRLAYRPLPVVLADGNKFNGVPCPFLAGGNCSVYEHRPLVCRAHHSLNDDARDCDPAEQALRPRRVNMYDPDLLEVPYMRLNMAARPTEPWGNIGEFFPD